MTTDLVPTKRIERAIYLIRGEQVLLDEDLARLYEVETRILTRAVKRNLRRFPNDFMFQLTREEYKEILRSQIGISRSGSYGGRRSLPYAFTEHGVTMLSSVLRSERAVDVSIQIVRAFVAMRRLATSHKEIALSLRLIERKLKQHDENFGVVFAAIKKLMSPPKKSVQRIGFHKDHDDR